MIWQEVVVGGPGPLGFCDFQEDMWTRAPSAVCLITTESIFSLWCTFLPPPLSPHAYSLLTFASSSDHMAIWRDHEDIKAEGNANGEYAWRNVVAWTEISIKWSTGWYHECFDLPNQP